MSSIHTYNQMDVENTLMLLFITGHLWLHCLFVSQLDPASHIVICFLFAQPLDCKLLSVNQVTNYTAGSAEWNHF